MSEQNWKRSIIGVLASRLAKVSKKGVILTSIPAEKTPTRRKITHNLLLLKTEKKVPQFEAIQACLQNFLKFKENEQIVVHFGIKDLDHMMRNIDVGALQCSDFTDEFYELVSESGKTENTSTK